MLIIKHSVHIPPYLSAGGSSIFIQISEREGGGLTGPQPLEGVEYVYTYCNISSKKFVFNFKRVLNG